MSDMIPLTALGTTEPRHDQHGSVTLSENANTALASFSARQGSESAAREALGSFINAALPEPGCAHFATVSAFWMGPDQWMVLAPHNSHEDLAAQLKAKAADTASVTEQNDAWCRFDLSGEGLAAVFELLCPVPVATCPAGHATRTSIDHLGCFVLVHGAEQVTVLGPRSSAGSLHHALLTAMRAAL